MIIYYFKRSRQPIDVNALWQGLSEQEREVTRAIAENAWTLLGQIAKTDGEVDRYLAKPENTHRTVFNLTALRRRLGTSHGILIPSGYS